MSGNYDVAQICLNGHVANWYAVGRVANNKKFCDRCGARTILVCPHCNNPIRGGFNGEMINIEPPQAPAFCNECGKPFPWTQSKIEAAKEFAKEAEGLSPEEKTTLADSIDDLVRDTPNSTISAQRFKKLAGKAGDAVLHGFRDILVGVITEAAKKAIFPQ